MGFFLTKIFRLIRIVNKGIEIIIIDKMKLKQSIEYRTKLKLE